MVLRRLSGALLAVLVGCRPIATGIDTSPPPADAGLLPADGDRSPADALGDSIARGYDAEPMGRSQLPRNLIVFMGDGMGPEQLSTGRYAKGGRLRIESMAGPAFVDTDSLTTTEADQTNPPPTDSAAAATAIATGVRVANGVLSQTSAGDPLESVLEACQRAGKATALVTTSYFFDASPAAFAAHQSARDHYEAIVEEMLLETQPDVILGSGAWLIDDPAYGLQELDSAGGYTVVRGAAAFGLWNPSVQPRLLGLFETNFVPVAKASEGFSMTPALERQPDSADPTLAAMTASALARLTTDVDGFFLFAEDETFDVIGHRGPAEVAWANRAYPAQALAFDEAVGVALDWVDEHSSFEETLIVVLADHETGGYLYDHAVGPESGQFTEFTDSGSYLVGHHTRIPTAVYALGPGSERLGEVTSHVDTHRLLIGALSD